MRLEWTAAGRRRRNWRIHLLHGTVRGFSRILSIELYPQRLQSPQPEIRAPLDRLRHKRDVREPTQEGLEYDLPFHASQRSAKTKVSGITERQMTIVFTGDVEFVGIGKALGIAVSGGHHRDHRLSLLDQLATHLPV